MRVRLLSACLVAWVLGHANVAAARNVEAGQIYLGAGVGPGFRLGHALGASAADFLLTVTGEYVATKRVGVVGDVVVGFGSTLPLWGRLGAKARLADLQLAISPYAQAEFAGGGLFHVMGSNLRWVGGRAGLGLDYFVTGRTTVGAGIFANLGSTLGQSPRFHGMLEVMIYGAFSVVAAPKAQPLRRLPAAFGGADYPDPPTGARR